ncbi:glycine cleavage system protein GcvH [Desulfurococcus amylolyticus]|uniref:Probable glycine cleavage system H protein n=1 Tax=Desulfurococcus amylolyticus DSM 16532 TaxID=768672 RepID=I3XRJ8_DESAM|nr:glycine cleavage system protein GcvH [Desulfurococcus amylolyticus]AFL66572.1 glycine cleavage system H protein [Desulfurococcus amylolyticus DSM 16532]
MSEVIVEVKGKKYIVKTDRRYTETDEWALLENGRIRVGISDYAQKELKDIVSVELPEVGRVVRKGEELGIIDSIKASSSYYAPVSGRIVEVNEELSTTPELLNKDPYGAGWIIVIEPSNPKEYEELYTPEKYSEKIRSGKQH